MSHFFTRLDYSSIFRFYQISFIKSVQVQVQPTSHNLQRKTSNPKNIVRKMNHSIGSSPNITSSSVPSPAQEPTNPSNPNPFDVLCGRGRGVSTHPGNIRFRFLVQSKREIYQRAEKYAKTPIADEVIEMVHSYGGRFVKKNSKTTQLQEVDRSVAREKVAHAFRDGNAWKKVVVTSKKKIGIDCGKSSKRALDQTERPVLFQKLVAFQDCFETKKEKPTTKLEGERQKKGEQQLNQGHDGGHVGTKVERSVDKKMDKYVLETSSSISPRLLVDNSQCGRDEKIEVNLEDLSKLIASQKKHFQNLIREDSITKKCG